jgi:hypothetical protein
MRASLAVLALGVLSTSVFAADDDDYYNSYSRIAGDRSGTSSSYADEEKPEFEDSKSPSLPVDKRNGSFSAVIQIETPTFRGIEPSLRLVYDSSDGIRNLPPAGGELGIGWSLQGVSAIQRVSGTLKVAGREKPPSRRGAPAYGAKGFAPDSFMLDGTELVACSEVENTKSTPSCASASNMADAFTSRFESFLRIRWERSSNTWEVTSRNGVKSLYRSLEGGSHTTTFRWHLASVTDTRGNRADYSWSCDRGHCTIDRISAYSSGISLPASEVQFYTELRPDPISYGDGLRMRTMTRRISTIQIKSAGSQQAAYRLTYEPSASTGLSRLVAVQKYGSDAVISNGVVTEGRGTALPAYRMTYANNGDSNGFPAFKRQSNWTAPGPAEVTADFNGDGWATDYLLPRLAEFENRKIIAWGGTFHSSDGSPKGLPANRFDRAPAGDGANSEAVVAIADVNGDARPDVIEAIVSWKKKNKKLDTDFEGYRARSIGADGVASQIFYLPDDSKKKIVYGGLAGDFNGDGQSDFLQKNAWIILSRPGNPANPVVADLGLRSIRNFEYKLLGIADVNGDGIDDVIARGKKKSTYQVFLSTGNEFVPQPDFKGESDRPVIADVNGDGLSDLIFVGPNDNGPRVITVRFSNGTNYSPAKVDPAAISSVSVTGSRQTRKSEKFKVGDFNGDGRADFVIRSAVIRARGASFETRSQDIEPSDADIVETVADFNGDGADDVATRRKKDQNENRWVWLSTTGQADLMTSFQEPLGGRVTVAYGPSAGTPGTRIPFNMQVVKSLNHYNGNIAVSTHSLAYEGGAWSVSEKRFLGFRKTTTTLPCIADEQSCPQEVKIYSQTPACTGQVEQEQTLDGPSGAILLQKTTAYAPGLSGILCAGP